MAQAPIADGRKLRSESSRRAIVAAMLALVREGNVSPGAEEVAARAAVGLRTVFRHFENMESLYREMSEAMAAEILPLAARPFAGASWRANIDELAERRAEIFERIMPLKLAADAHRHHSPFIASDAADFARRQRQMLLAVLPPVQAQDAERLEALDLVLSFDVWRRLRHEQKLSRARALAVVKAMLARLL